MTNYRGIPHSLTVPAQYSHIWSEWLELNINPSSTNFPLPTTILRTEWSGTLAATRAEWFDSFEIIPPEFLPPELLLWDPNLSKTDGVNWSFALSVFAFFEFLPLLLLSLLLLFSFGPLVWICYPAARRQMMDLSHHYYSGSNLHLAEIFQLLFPQVIRRLREKFFSRQKSHQLWICHHSGCSHKSYSSCFGDLRVPPYSLRPPIFSGLNFELLLVSTSWSQQLRSLFLLDPSLIGFHGKLRICSY